MLRLDLASEPRWLDLGHCARLRLAPLTTALMVAARADLAVAALTETAAPEALAFAMANAPARRGVRSAVRVRAHHGAD